MKRTLLKYAIALALAVLSYGALVLCCKRIGVLGSQWVANTSASVRAPAKK